MHLYSNKTSSNTSTVYSLNHLCHDNITAFLLFIPPLSIPLLYTRKLVVPFYLLGKAEKQSTLKRPSLFHSRIVVLKCFGSDHERCLRKTQPWSPTKIDNTKMNLKSYANRNMAEKSRQRRRKWFLYIAI